MNIPRSSTKFGLYLHWPYCLSKCPYCDFNSHVRDQHDEDGWLQAMCQELTLYQALVEEKPVTSIYFGGGTPSLMHPKTVDRVLAHIKQLWDLTPDCEITLEANPTSTEAEKLKAFRQAGVNRVSLGVQSLRDQDLKFLGREHNAAEAWSIIQTLPSLFDRYSFDLIYARPGQTVATWLDELSQAIPGAGDHISLYQLTIEPGTAFEKLYDRKEFHLPEEDIAVDLYEATEDFLAQRGYAAYEVSNYAKPGGESRHNLTYWRYQDYLGIGPGAHGRWSDKDGQKWATYNHKSPEIWAKTFLTERQGWKEKTLLDGPTMATECVMMGLRLQEGVELGHLEALLQSSVDKWLNQKSLSILIEENLLQKNKNYIKVTQQGRLKLNSVISYLIN